MRAETERSLRGAGFSLIELLVVISIIALLIAIILPALPAVMDSARRTGCLANLRSMGQAIELYKGDWQEKYPDARYMPRPWLAFEEPLPELDDPITLRDEAFVQQSLPVVLSDYLDFNSEGYQCPGDPGIWSTRYIDQTEDGPVEKVSGVSFNYGDLPDQLRGRAYFESVYTTGKFSFWDPDEMRWVQLPFTVDRLVRSPEQVALMRDFDGGTFYLEADTEVFTDLGLGSDDVVPGARNVTVDFFHSERSILYADGHAAGVEG